MRALSIGLMVLGLMGIALVGVTFPVDPANKVVIGVLDVEATGMVDFPERFKKPVMKDFRRNKRVKVVDIGESCDLSALKRNGYEQAERYRKRYQLDMILHCHMTGYLSYQTYLNLIDLYTKKIKEVTVETKWPEGIPFYMAVRGISKKLLPKEDLNRVLRAKKKASGK